MHVNAIVALLYNDFIPFIKMSLPKKVSYILLIYFKTFKYNYLVSFNSFILLSFPSLK